MSKTDGVEVPDSRRPALRKLTFDIQETREELLAGFPNRRAVLFWAQRLTVRTLGELPQEWYRALAREFELDDDGRDGTFLNALLEPSARSRPVERAAAKRARRAEYATRILPTVHPSFRTLRKDAGEYVGDSEEQQPGHDPATQRYIAMRPAIDELESDQRAVLEALLDGFGHPDEILEWGDRVELATHGEPIKPDAPGTFVSRCYQEPATRAMLLEDTRAKARAREWFAARWLLPAYNRGVRDLAGRAGEEVASNGADAIGDAPAWSDIE